METLSELLDEAAMVPLAERLEWLVELGEDLPAPSAAAGELRRLPECQSPVSWAARLDASDVFHLAITVPSSAVVVRGFAGLIVPTLDGRPAQQVRTAPTDLVGQLGLGDAVSPLRLRGLHALWNHVRAAAEPVEDPAGLA